MIKILIVIVIYSILKQVPKLISVFQLDYKDFLEKQIKKRKTTKEKIVSATSIKESTKTTLVRVIAIVFVMVQISILVTLIYKTNG